MRRIGQQQSSTSGNPAQGSAPLSSNADDQRSIRPSRERRHREVPPMNVVGEPKGSNRNRERSANFSENRASASGSYPGSSNLNNAATLSQGANGNGNNRSKNFLS